MSLLAQSDEECTGDDPMGQSHFLEATSEDGDSSVLSSRRQKSASGELKCAERQHNYC